MSKNNTTTTDTSIIDELYENYLSYPLHFAKDSFLSEYYNKPENGGGKTLIENIKNYIEETTNTFVRNFASFETKKSEEEIIENLVYVIEDLTSAVNDLLDNYEFLQYSKITRNNFNSVELLNMNLDLIKSAYQKNLTRNPESEFDYVGDIQEETFNNFIKFLQFLKTNKSLKNVYKSSEWKSLPLKEILTNLYDYHNKNKIFDIGKKELYEMDNYVDYEVSYFKKIKNNCSKISKINLDQYRPNFISKKAINLNFEKLSFCRNLLNFYKTGIMPESYTNTIDFQLDAFEESELKTALKKCYSKSFDVKNFKSQQCNTIFNIDQPIKCPEKLVTHQSIYNNNSLAVGFLLSTQNNDYTFENETYYLLHVYIEDITNPTCNYELQLNLLPDSKIENRIQIIRLDNWNKLQTHKNLSKKLTTTTHIHLYNALDLIRGKKDGGFDIGFNTNSSVTDLVTSLKTFMDILDLDYSMCDTIINKINKKLAESQNQLNL